MKLFLVATTLLSISRLTFAQVNPTDTNTVEEECKSYYSIIGKDDGSCCVTAEVNDEKMNRYTICENGHIIKLHLESELSRNDYFNDFPEDIFNFKNLKELYMSGNYFKTIPPRIQELTELESLNLYNNTIYELPRELFNLKNLKELLLEENNIEDIPSDLDKEIGREKINISSNRIKDMGIGIFEFKNLKELNLQNNKINRIPFTVRYATQLEILNLNHNYIHEIPNELFELKNLKKLYLSSNEIKNVSPLIIGLTELEELDLSSNHIKNMPDTAIDNLKNLKVKNLENQENKELKEGIYSLIIKVGFYILFFGSIIITGAYQAKRAIKRKEKSRISKIQQSLKEDNDLV